MKVKPASCGGYSVLGFDPGKFCPIFPVIGRLISILLWSLPLFRVRGIRLEVHPTFFLLVAYAGYMGWKLGGGWASAIVTVLTLLAIFVCVVLHEFGHAFTARSFGVGIRRILLLPVGGMADFEKFPREPVRELLVTLAGPAVNLMIAAGLYLAAGLPPGWEFFSLPDYPATPTGLAHLLIHANLAMAAFNLLPVFPMDGGRIVRALLAGIGLPHLRATYVAVMMGKILGGTAIVVVLYVCAPGPDYLAALPFAVVVVAGELELRATRHYEVEDAHWRAYYVRINDLKAESGATAEPNGQPAKESSLS